MHVVCLSAGVLQINQPISLTMIEPISWLTFDSDLVPETDYGSLFHFPYHY